MKFASTWPRRLAARISDSHSEDHRFKSGRGHNLIKRCKIRYMSTANLKTTSKKVLRGSIIMTVDDQVYTTKDAKKVAGMIKEIEKKHHKKPLITVIPKEDTLILFVNK